MSDDKMRETVDEQLPRDRFGDDPREYFCMGYEVACASKDAEIAKVKNDEQVWRTEWESISETAKQLQQQLAAKDAALQVAINALNEIAYWDGGATVNGGFDEPGSAGIARDAITQIEEARK